MFCSSGFHKSFYFPSNCFYLFAQKPCLCKKSLLFNNTLYMRMWAKSNNPTHSRPIFLGIYSRDFCVGCYLFATPIVCVNIFFLLPKISLFNKRKEVQKRFSLEFNIRELGILSGGEMLIAVKCDGFQIPNYVFLCNIYPNLCGVQIKPFRFITLFLSK